MKNLKCDAEKCVYNKSRECHAGKINVDGHDATRVSETYCATFREKDNNSFSSHSDSCCHHEHTVGTDQIRCEAVHCVYNQQKLCNAPSVQINDMDASCNTFKTE